MACFFKHSKRFYNTRILQSIDCHAGGEPARVIIGGMPHVNGVTMEEKRKYFMNNMDDLRKLLLTEPRGYPCQNANIIFESSNPLKSSFGYIILEQNKIYPAMSGHNTICVATALLETGMIPINGNDIKFTLEAPSGLIDISAKFKNGKATQITLTNTESFIDENYMNLSINLPLSISSILTSTPKSLINDENNVINVDIAWGGMWYVIVNIEQLKKYGFELIASKGKDIVKLGEIIKICAAEQYAINLSNYSMNDIDLMDYAGPDILCFRDSNDNRNAVVMSNNVLLWDKPETWTGMIDRSPCGTGTAAVMTLLHNKNKLSLNEEFVHQSIINTEFVGKIIAENNNKIYNKKTNKYIKSITPTISGQAWITQHSQIILHSTDPFQQGYTVNDIW